MKNNLSNSIYLEALARIEPSHLFQKKKNHATSFVLVRRTELMDHLINAQSLELVGLSPNGIKDLF